VSVLVCAEGEGVCVQSQLIKASHGVPEERDSGRRACKQGAGAQDECMSVCTGVPDNTIR
jgi:hypothetical protein